MIILKQNLQNIIEPFIYKKLKKDAYEVKIIDPKKLLTWNRFVIVFNLYYLDLYNKNEKLAKQIYKEMIRATSLGTFVESKYEKDKNCIDKYFYDFTKTYNSIKEEGFDDTKSLIPVANDYSILNGTHRVASAIHLDKKVSIIECELDNIIDDYSALYDRNIPIEILDLIAINFINYADNVYLAFLWPSGKGFKKEVESKFSKVVYKKDILLTPKGGFNLIIELYRHMDWVGTVDNGFLGAKEKLLECFPNFDYVRVIAFQANTLDDVNKIKEEVRKIYDIGYSSIHITDTKEEAIRVSQLIFNKNGLHFLNYADPYKYISQYDEINKFKEFIKNNNINKNDIIVDGSFTLSLYGIRKSEDIDYIINNEDLISHKNKLFESHEDQLVYHKEKKEDILYNPKFYFYFYGIKFISFLQLYRMKKNRNEEKDRNDCQIMDAFLSHDRLQEFLSKIKQNLFYFRIKISHRLREIIVKVLVITNLYKPIRVIYRKLKDFK